MDGWLEAWIKGVNQTPVLSKNQYKGAPSGRSRLPGCDCNHTRLCVPKGAGFLYARREVQYRQRSCWSIVRDC